MHSSLEYRKAMSQLRTRQALAMSQTGYGDGRSACLCRSQIFEQAFPCRLGFWSKGIALCSATDANGLRSGLNSVRPPPLDWLVEAVLAHRKELDHPQEL
jgi:hypothetical protein